MAGNLAQQTIRKIQQFIDDAESFGDDPDIEHIKSLIAEYVDGNKPEKNGPDRCPECGSTETEVRNYSLMWHDGDVYCENGHYVRMYDAG